MEHSDPGSDLSVNPGGAEIGDRPKDQVRKSSGPTLFTSESNWWLFCLGIVVLKFLLLAVDSAPKLYLGDSISYIWTALTGWIPEDRSYFYGFVIRGLSVWTHSLTPLLIVQAALGAVIAIVLTRICRTSFGLSERLSYLFGFLCAIDPLQLLWERYVMTETFSLFFYALFLQQSFDYLQRRRITNLVLIQFLSIMAVGFRVVYLLSGQIAAVALPLIAFISQSPAPPPPSGPFARLQFLKRPILWQHLAVSVCAMVLFDQSYKHAYGFVAHREPAYLYQSGYFLLTSWAPALQPQDATDPRLAKIIEQGNEYGLRDLDLRDSQRFRSGRLIDRWRRVEPDRRKTNEIAARTALNAFRRDPATVIGLAAKTYFLFYNVNNMKRFLTYELGAGTLQPSHVALLAERFHWTGPADIAAEPMTVTRWYYVAAWPYYFLPLLSPLFAAALLVFARNKALAWFLCIQTIVMFGVITLLSMFPIMRYFQSLSLLALLNVALVVKSLLPKATGTSTTEQS